MYAGAIERGLVVWRGQRRRASFEEMSKLAGLPQNFSRFDFGSRASDSPNQREKSSAAKSTSPLPPASLIANTPTAPEKHFQTVRHCKHSMTRCDSLQYMHGRISACQISRSETEMQP
jgi:hypothetical protein